MNALQAARFLDNLFADQTGQACLGYIDGDPSIPDGAPGYSPMRSKYYDWPQERDAAIRWLAWHDAQGHNTYVRHCLFIPGKATNQKNALPSPWVWRDDVQDPRTAYTILVETSEQNYQALIKLDRPAKTAERKRIMTAWRDNHHDSCACSADPIHFVRIPGGHNTKNGGNWQVRYAGQNDRVFPADKLLARCQPAGGEKHTPPDAPAALDGAQLDYWQAHIDQLLNDDRTLPRAFVRDTPGRRILELRAQGSGMLFHASGTWDASRERLWLANSLVIARYLDEQIAALLWHFEVAETVAIKGRSRVWADIHRVIAMARAAHPEVTPRLYGVRPAPKTKVTRGRAGSHPALVEQVYSILQDARAGAQAIVKTGEIAGVIGCHRRTVVTILNELRDAKRIETAPIGQHGGLIITFSGVIYSPAPEAAQPAAMPETAPAPIALGETGSQGGCVSPDRAEADHTSPTLAELAKHYLDQPASAIGERLVSKKTGAITYRRTAKHFAALVTAEYPYTEAQAIAAYKADQALREIIEADIWQRFFARLRAMANDELIAYVTGGCRRDVAELSREGAVFDKHQYQVRLKCAKQHLGWRGLTLPKRATRIRIARPGDAWQPEDVPVVLRLLPLEDLPATLPSVVDVGAIVARLKAQQEAAHG